MTRRSLKRRIVCASTMALAALSVTLAVRTRPVIADSNFFQPGNLVVSSSIYDNNANNVTVGVTQLPLNCSAPSGSCTSPATTAAYGGLYPQVFNNDLVDGSFGITSKILLDQTDPTTGIVVSTLEVPNSSQNGVPPTKDQMVTSFSSKSEIALNLSTDGSVLSFMGYRAPIDAIDVSNSNTPAAVDPTNPVGENYDRVFATVDAHGKLRYTLTNAYSGNNGRAAIYNNSNGANVAYLSGNAGNGGNPQPVGILLGGGAQFLSPVNDAEVAQKPALPMPLASFNITQLGDKADKIGKDNNFRGLTIFNNVVYYTKGSGGNGVNTVYFVDTTTSGGNTGVCNDSTGIGLPAPGASLPTSPLAYDPAILNASPSGGLDPNNMCVLKGLPSGLAKNDTTFFPFGIWFANATTLYIANEGDGYATGSDLYTHAAGQTGTPPAAYPAGIEKWVFSGGSWNYAYTLQAGLGLGTAYTPSGTAGNNTSYPMGLNLATCVVAKTNPPQSNPNNCPVSKNVTVSNQAPNGLPWAPAPDGLRNIAGRVNGDGTVTIWGITSTVSGSGDQGADPNQLVAIKDNLSYTSAAQAAGETFTVLRTARSGEVLRGVSLTPGTH